MQRLADLRTGVLQDELRVTRRVDERQEWQPDVGELFGALDLAVVLYSQILFCYQQCFRNERKTRACMRLSCLVCIVLGMCV
jgi:hypothetical protein